MKIIAVTLQSFSAEGYVEHTMTPKQVFAMCKDSSKLTGLDAKDIYKQFKKAKYDVRSQSWIDFLNDYHSRQT